MDYLPKLTVAALTIAVTSCGHDGHVISDFNSMFGPRNIDGSRQPRAQHHNGVDIGPLGDQTPVIASADGHIESISMSETSGFGVIIRHTKTPEQEPDLENAYFWTGYGHLYTVYVTKGAWVRRGDQIGRVGLFADSGGVIHVHWQMCSSSSCSFPNVQDPLKFSGGWFHGHKKYRDTQITLPVTRESIRK